MPQYLLDKLQRIQNAAARVVMLVPKFEHITPVMVELHWFPVKYQIMYKIFFTGIQVFIRRGTNLFARDD